MILYNMTFYNASYTVNPINTLCRVAMQISLKNRRSGNAFLTLMQYSLKIGTFTIV